MTQVLPNQAWPICLHLPAALRSLHVGYEQTHISRVTLGSTSESNGWNWPGYWMWLSLDWHDVDHQQATTLNCITILSSNPIIPSFSNSTSLVFSFQMISILLHTTIFISPLTFHPSWSKTCHFITKTCTSMHWPLIWGCKAMSSGSSFASLAIQSSHLSRGYDRSKCQLIFLFQQG